MFIRRRNNTFMYLSILEDNDFQVYIKDGYSFIIFAKTKISRMN